MSWQSTPTWHLDETTLRAYVDGHPLSVVGASVESHLLECPDCRVRLGELMSHETVDEAWAAIRAHVEAPRRSVAERLIRRFGVSAESARLLAAVPAFRGAWLLGLFAVTLFAGLAALFAGDVRARPCSSSWRRSPRSPVSRPRSAATPTPATSW